jgi:hypothetical protein
LGSQGRNGLPQAGGISYGQCRQPRHIQGKERRFGHHRQFLKFCGLDLSTQQSGTSRGRTKLSKYGNARDRHNADLRRKALTAITAKTARVVHAVIKSGADYRPFVEGPVPGGEPLSADVAHAELAQHPADQARAHVVAAPRPPVRPLADQLRGGPGVVERPAAEPGLASPVIGPCVSRDLGGVACPSFRALRVRSHFWR